jgi:hypothetical protein
MEVSVSLQLMFVFTRVCVGAEPTKWNWLVKAFVGEHFGNKFQDLLLAKSQQKEFSPK